MEEIESLESHTWVFEMAGYYILFNGLPTNQQTLKIDLMEKPHFFHRKMMRLCFGFVWVDY